MTLENQVTIPELSIKLKELGVKQNAYWTWYRNADTYHLTHNPDGFRGIEIKSFDALTIAELGEMLQKRFDMFSSSGETSTVPIFMGDCYVWYVHGVATIKGDTEANARAKMLIYLLENKLI